MDVQRNLQIVISAKDEATKVLKGFKDKVDDWGGSVAKGGLALSALGATTTLFAKSVVDAAGEMEATKTAFNTLIGDSKLAEKTLKDLFTLEKRTPFTIQSILTESKKLLAMGTNAKDLTKTLEMLGDVAAGVGFEKLPQLTLAFGQIQAKGRLMGTELRQLTEAGFNLAEAMGVSNEKLEEMISDKEVGFEDVRKAFEKVTGEGGRFEGMMADLAKTTPGRLSTMESSVYQLKVAIGEALLPALNRLLDLIMPLIESFAAWAKENQTLVAILIGLGLVLGVIGVALVTIGGIVMGLSAVISALGAVFSAVGAIIGVIIGILGGPLTLIILAVIALVALFAAAWANNWLGIRDKAAAVVNWFKDTAWPTIQNVFNSIKEKVGQVAGFFVDKFNGIRDAINGVINTIGGLINKAVELGNKVKGGLKIPGFQHGGFVPGSYGQAVPAILHGGERVIPRNGVDVNPGLGGGSSVNINISGSFQLDSDQRVQELADKIIGILGRQNELAAKGLGI